MVNIIHPSLLAKLKPSFSRFYYSSLSSSSSSIKNAAASSAPASSILLGRFGCLNTTSNRSSFECLNRSNSSTILMNKRMFAAAAAKNIAVAVKSKVEERPDYGPVANMNLFTAINNAMHIALESNPKYDLVYLSICLSV